MAYHDGDHCKKRPKTGREGRKRSKGKEKERKK
jgi:hypothetical protein